MSSFSFPSRERLKSKKSITLLFERGKSVFSLPVRGIWEIFQEKEDYGIKAGFSVPKRIFRRAVDRNLIKRRMREAYRNNKSILNTFSSSENHTLHIMFLYTSDAIVDYSAIEQGIREVLRKIGESLKTKKNHIKLKSGN